jgi:hypothetical protein
MRTSPKPIITAHRLARLNAWARLWLAWVVGLFAAWWSRGERIGARDLDQLAHRVGRIVVVNAAARFAPPPKSRHRHGRLQRVRVRTILGARLRRAMRGKDAPSRLFAILTVMRDLDRVVALLLKRLPRGLTRLRAVLPLPAAAAPFTPSAPIACASADTS